MLEAWLVWLLPLVGALFVPAVSRLGARFCSWFAIAIGAVTSLLGFYQAFTFTAPYVGTLGGWAVYNGVTAEVKVDGLSVLLTAFVASLSLIILVYSAGNMKHEAGQARFYSLVLIFIGAMIGLVMAGNLVQLYLFWEIVGICSALLIAFWTDRESARRAGFKAFVVTRIGDIALLTAVIMILVNLHTSSIDGVIAAVSAPGSSLNWVIVGILILVGAMGKSAQVPLHVWLPDAMEGPTPVSALIHAATMVNAGVYLLVRLYPIYASSSVLSSSVLVVGLVSMLVGAACASAARDFKRVLAYSTISQLGLMFAAIGIGSWSGAVYQLVSQGIFKALAFMAAGSVIEVLGSRSMDDMGGLARRMKYTYVAFMFAALAMAGLPPLIGFWTKEAILSTALSYGLGAFLVLLLGSTLTSFYSFRALFRVFHGPENPREVHESGSLMVTAMIVLLILASAGWLILVTQGIFAPPLGTSPDLWTSVASVSLLVAILVTAYVAFVKRPQATWALMESNTLLRGLDRLLLEGIWFDRFYDGLVHSVLLPTVGYAKRIQSGDLGRNAALLLALLLAVMLLTFGGVV